MRVPCLKPLIQSFLSYFKCFQILHKTDVLPHTAMQISMKFDKWKRQSDQKQGEIQAIQLYICLPYNKIKFL